MKRTKLLLSSIAVFAVVGVALAFTPANTNQQCLYVPIAGGTGCTLVGKVDAGTTPVTGAFRSPNMSGVCPSPPTSCNEEVEIQNQQ